MKRFILLKGNRIIDVSKYEVSQEKRLLGNATFYKKDELITTKNIFIIKEADNLIDLIEVGDLVEIVETSISIKREYMGFTEGRGWICLEGCPFFRIDEFEDNLLKIYKPNQNRGYDLAWERKE